MTEIWTAQQWRDYEAKKQGKKGRAVKSTCLLEKHAHGSKMEALECDWHFARLRNGEIARAKWQYTLEIRFNGKLFKKWKIDFAEWDHADKNKKKPSRLYECKGYNFSDRDYVMRRDAFVLANPAAKLYINRELWTGKPKRKAVSWRMRDVKRSQKRRAQNDRERRAHLRKTYFHKPDSPAGSQAFQSAREAAKAAAPSTSGDCRTPKAATP